MRKSFSSSSSLSFMRSKYLKLNFFLLHAWGSFLLQNPMKIRGFGIQLASNSMIYAIWLRSSIQKKLKFETTLWKTYKPCILIIPFQRMKPQQASINSLRFQKWLILQSSITSNV